MKAMKKSTRTAANKLVIFITALASQVAMASAGSATTRPATTEPSDGTYVLTTKHFIVTIVDDRGEGEVTNDHVLYRGVSRRSGKSIRLVGSTWHAVDSTGTPGQFYGYMFHNGHTSYRLYVSGTLEIRRDDDQILLSEDGTWHREP